MAGGTKIRYVGAHKEVEVPTLGISVKRNHQITVEDAAIATSLLEQSDNWKEVKAGGNQQVGETTSEEGS